MNGEKKECLIEAGFAISLALTGASASGFTVAPLLVQLSQTIGLRLAVVEPVLVGWAVLIPIIQLCTRRESGVPRSITVLVDRSALPALEPGYVRRVIIAVQRY
jgi:hypothetical protein